MLNRLEYYLRKLRRALSRSEWTVRLLGYPTPPDAAMPRGLVLIQIDGFAYDIAKAAIESGRMPFLRGLMSKDGYQFKAVYSGVPSTTPSVQGEFFYGVESAVPAFSFVDRETGRIMRMYDRNSAAQIERALPNEEGLLAGGSAYCDIYSGGAEYSRFCASTGTLGDFVRSKWPWAVPFLFVMHAFSLVRIAFLLPVELALALWDFVRGVIEGHDLRAEFKFVPVRVAICILLREFLVISAKVDIARGLPVVHLNLIGYDEQAHRRGPKSLFALWTLKGIDTAVSRIVRALRRSVRRDYDVWIYSDHGQETSESYLKIHGHPVHDAIADVLVKYGFDAASHQEPPRGVQMQRVSVFGETLLKRLLIGADSDESPVGTSAFAVTAMGPVGHVYLPGNVAGEVKAAIAQDFVDTAAIPMVLVAIDESNAKVWTEQGVFELPRDSADVLGKDHPYRESAARDLAQLCSHRYAGDLIISGLRAEGPNLSFPRENGSHGGPGPSETSAFALIPAHTQIKTTDGAPLRFADLRQEGLRILGRPIMPRTIPRYQKHDRDAVRIMTYNVHSCVGIDGKHSPERIARVIAQYEPDIVALQELDMGRARTLGIDQAQVIGDMLEMLVHFHPAMEVEEELYGDAFLSRYHMELIQASPLPQFRTWPYLEPRGALWVDIELRNRVYHFFNTHLSLHPWERRIQARALAGEDWLLNSRCTGPRVLCGDFNARPQSAVCRSIGNILHDSQVIHENHRPKRTFHSRYPVGRIDHVFVEPDIKIVHIDVPSTQLTRVASDHLPLIVEFRVD